MLARITLHLIIVLGTLGFAGVAMGQDKVHNYLNDTALKVKATESPAEKRTLLTSDLSNMIKTLETVKDSPMTSEQDDVNLDRLQASLQEKSDELAGVNGYDPVPDDELNAFSMYIVQDMEQADKNVTISLVTLLLIIIIVILIV